MAKASRPVGTARSLAPGRPAITGQDDAADVSGMSWHKALDQYATAQRAAGRSPGTIKLHRHYLTNLAKTVSLPWLATHLELLEYMGTPQWQPETRKSARAALRGFYRWGHGMGYVEDDPAIRLPSVHIPPPAPRPTPETLVQQLLDERCARLEFMARLGVLAGLRAAEIARVAGGDLDIADDLHVEGKGKKRRAIPVEDARLRSMLRAVPLGQWAFPSPAGGHLTPGHVTKLLSQALGPGWSGHTLRHRFATDLHEIGVDVLIASELLGHSRVETTQRYTKTSADRKRAAIRGLSSRAA